MAVKHPRRWLAAAVSMLVLMTIGLGGFVWYGVYNVAALEQHTAPVYRLLQFAMVRSVAARSEAEPPDLHERDWQIAGLLHYRDHCQQCHGAPGVAPEPFSLGMVPAPTAIAEIARKREAREIFWVIKNGIKMSGMPAWDYRLHEDEMWDLVAFIKQMSSLTVAEYQVLQARAERHGLAEATGPQHDPEDLPSDQDELIRRGRIALQQYNCTSCHEIPGVTAARNHVGPPLEGITRRTFISGVLKNTDDNLVRWIRFPQQIDPATTMPDLNVSEAHAKEMVAYFHSMDENK